MSEFYRMKPTVWDAETVDLTLEQEAAYLRICNAIYAADRPLRENYRVLAGMFRTGLSKARKLVAALVAAGKIRVENGWILQDFALSDIESRQELSKTRAECGRIGGKASGKPLKSNGRPQAIASPRKEEKREEKTVCFNGFKKAAEAAGLRSVPLPLDDPPPAEKPERRSRVAEGMREFLAEYGSPVRRTG